MAGVAVAVTAQESAEEIEQGVSQRGVGQVATETPPLERAQTALDGGRLEEAEAEFRQLVEEQPDSAAASFGLGAALARLRRGSEAMEHFQRAAELDPTAADPLVAIGDLHFGRGQLDEALAHYRAGVEIDATSERGRLGEVQIMHRRGQYREVSGRLAEAREVLPDSGLVAYSLAWMLAASPDASLRDGERALDLAQGVFESHSSLPNVELVAEALAELDRCDKAAEFLREMGATVPRAEAPEIAERIQQGIERFDKGSPCRAPTEPSASVEE